ncbi:MAG: CAAX prenyl protease-related protein [Desulfohalobiaceae bacterium]|nr:CAAX prenyl protease-related protein [Desulfohalobiaceae bacterium]
MALKRVEEIEAGTCGQVPALTMPAIFPYVLPFFFFALITYLGPLLDLPAVVAYPLKTVLVGASLIFFWRRFHGEIRWQMDWPAVAGGILVFLVWILAEGHYPQLAGQAGRTPFSFESHHTFFFYVLFRLLGAAVVVPIMEELFWRSFALRFLIDSGFKKIALGRFTWFSFLTVSLAFGFEHHRWLPGIAAGLVYALLLYRSKNLFSPILSHALTNLLLGLYVLKTGQWGFW